MNIAVAQSGGPTAAINASLCGVYKMAKAIPEIDKIYGSVCGIEGIINDNIIDLSVKLSDNEDIELLKLTPSTALGSCRYKMPDPAENADPYELIERTFEKYDIGMFFYIGGNDSMDTVSRLDKYFKSKNKDIKVMGVPKTIDNDLCVTDHTPGFGSAAKYVASTMLEIIRDSSVYSAQSVTIVEIMGRHAGWLTASVCVLKKMGETAPHLIYLPESEFSVEKFLNDVRQAQKEHKAVVVAVSEGIEAGGDYDVGEFRSGVNDAFGHKYLSGIGKCLERIVAAEIGCKVRSIELNIMQRCSVHIASQTDLDEAERIGADAVRAAYKGNTGKVMVFKRVCNYPYTVVIESVDADEIANKEKKFPEKWIINGSQISEDAIDYFLPLIKGEPQIRYQFGMPLHKKLI